MVKRKRYRFRQGDVIDVEEFHDGRYGGPGTGRAKRAKPTEEQMRAVNAQNKAKRCRQRMLEYFHEGDIFATWTYEVRNRPPDMRAALKDFQKAMRYVRREFKKRGYEVFWIRNIERGTKGAWHIHLVINEIGDTASIITKAFLTPEKALEYGLIDRVDSYQADDKDVQQRLMSRVQQLSGVIAQQKSFREQLESMRQQGGEPKPPVPTPKPEPEEKKLTNQLAKLFQNM